MENGKGCGNDSGFNFTEAYTWLLMWMGEETNLYSECRKTVTKSNATRIIVTDVPMMSGVYELGP